jgi:hypothetical protein
MDSKPICPHCGHVEQDAWEINFGPGLDGDTVACCNSCGEDYFLERIVSVYYKSAKLREKNGGAA